MFRTFGAILRTLICFARTIYLGDTDLPLEERFHNLVSKYSLQRHRECFTGLPDALTISGAPHFRHRRVERLAKKFTFIGHSFRVNNEKVT